MASSCASDIRSVTVGVVASSSLGISDATTRTNVPGSVQRRGHQRRLAEREPSLVQIGDETPHSAYCVNLAAGL